MSELPDELHGFADMVRHRKEARIKHAVDMRAGNPDLPSLMEFWRDGQFVAFAETRETNRDEMLQAAWQGIPGYGADEVRVSHEMYWAGEEWFKRHGKRKPDPGEFQRLWERGNPGGLLSECIGLIWMKRDGRHVFANQLYELDRKTRTLTWAPDVQVLDSDEGASLGGILYDNLRHFFEQGPADPATHGLRFEDFGLTAEQARIHMDAANTQVMAHSGFVVGMAATSEYAVDAFKHAAKSDSTLEALLYDADADTTVELEKGTELSMLDAFGPLLRVKLRDARKQVHREEQEYARMNRAQRRAAARGKRR